MFKRLIIIAAVASLSIAAEPAFAIKNVKRVGAGAFQICETIDRGTVDDDGAIKVCCAQDSATGVDYCVMCEGENCVYYEPRVISKSEALKQLQAKKPPVKKK
jgi:hypothetical protein